MRSSQLYKAAMCTLNWRHSSNAHTTWIQSIVSKKELFVSWIPNPPPEINTPSRRDADSTDQRRHVRQTSQTTWQCDWIIYHLNCPERNLKRCAYRQWDSRAAHATKQRELAVIGSQLVNSEHWRIKLSERLARLLNDILLCFGLPRRFSLVVVLSLSLGLVLTVVLSFLQADLSSYLTPNRFSLSCSRRISRCAFSFAYICFFVPRHKRVRLRWWWMTLSLIYTWVWSDRMLFWNSFTWSQADGCCVPISH